LPTVAPRPKTSSERAGRVTPKGRPSSGRYTPPIPRQIRRSPRWYPWMLLGLLLLGVLLIVLNYVNALPSSPTNWYTLGGLVCILTGALLSTRYR
jgi:hypothetical protein